MKSIFLITLLFSIIEYSKCATFRHSKNIGINNTPHPSTKPTSNPINSVEERLPQLSEFDVCFLKFG